MRFERDYEDPPEPPGAAEIHARYAARWYGGPMEEPLECYCPCADCAGEWEDDDDDDDDDDDE